ncbi:hypothetical protein AZF37_05405 [endosymbiont 'TC1' of Trimyema compressum]|uniref:helix-turn-helix domain-containing protein n=1 Tax=endosymbiont 'TC1' of Trimyema compressum TaxID=243899 RepID=UPI0007F17663|nr:helix-turn-helix transcriptional regulator [endosymbiont 'TC1' of Trimyema compressum]AMP20690.1 hypothetical protein AZF37_05405 [endosymbiont 'TC1' of Trimyema compressum]
MFSNKIKNLTQKELASIFNLSQSSIALYEKGIRMPDFKTLAAYASYFNVSTDYLLGLSCEDKTNNTYKAENSDYESFIYLNKNDFQILGKAIEVKTTFPK